LDEEVYWKDEFMESYLAVFAKYNDRIKLIMSAHAHPGEIRAPLSSRYPSLSLPILMNPSVSPLGFIMPAYTILDLPLSSSPTVTWRFLQLLEYFVTQYPMFETFDLQKSLNVDLGNVTSIRAFS